MKVVTKAGGMKHSSLEHNKRRSDSLFDLNFDDITLIERDSRHSQQIRGTDEKVSVERSQT